MNRSVSPFAIAIACLAVAACATKAERIADKEDLLAAAGFAVRPADSPARRAQLKQLPANKFVTMANGDQVKYVYADPVDCNCLYVGDQKAYGAYKQEVFSRNLADQQQQTAELNSDQWNWGAWGWDSWGPGWSVGVGPGPDIGVRDGF
jgi:hypothetical protein